MWSRPPVVEALHGPDSIPYGPLPLGGIVDVVIVQGKEGVVALLYVGRNISHQSIEVLDPLHQADGKTPARCFSSSLVWMVISFSANISPVAEAQFAGRPPR